MAKTLRPLALLLTVSTVAMMAGCASIYAPSKEAIKQRAPDEGYADFVYVHLAKVWPEEEKSVRKSCEKTKAEGKPLPKACDNPDDYVMIKYTTGIVGGVSIGGKQSLLIKKSTNPEPGMIIKLNMRYGADEGVLEVRKPTEDCKWVGNDDPNLDTVGTKVANKLAAPVGTLVGLAVGPVSAPVAWAMEMNTVQKTAGIVCDGWDYRIAYKSWLENYRNL
jgi:hypothetical protein